MDAGAKTLRLLLSLVMLQLFTCSLPTDTKPAQWKTYIEVPVENKRFETRDLLPDEIASGLAIDFDKDKPTDTVRLVKNDTLSYTVNRELVSVDTSIIEKTLGAVTLKNTPPVDLEFNLLEAAGNTAPVGTALPTTVSLDQSRDKQLNGIISVTFDETSPELVVTLENSASRADLHDLGVSIESGGSVFSSASTPLLPAGETQTVTLAVNDRTIYNVITVTITATLEEGAIAQITDGLNVSFSLDGLIAADAVLQDSMISYSDELSGEIGLAEGIMLDAIDIEDALLLCEIQNPASLKVALDAFIDDAWELSYVDELKIDEIGELSEADDSIHYTGQIIADTLFENPTETATVFHVTLNQMRVFPTWDSDSSKSILHYRYRVTAIPDGRSIHFNKNDVLIFKLVPDRFPFIKIKGTFFDPLLETFSTKQDIGFGWESSILDSLKRYFRFSSVGMALRFTPDLPEKSTIDSLQLHIAMQTNTDPDDSVVIDRKIISISPDSIYSQEIDIADLLNDWPDSIGFNSELGLPAMTGVELYNKKDEQGNYSNTLTIGIDIQWELKIPFAWELTGTMLTELEQSEIDLGLDDLDVINKLRKKRIILSLEVLNNTNLTFKLFAFGASKQYNDELNEFTVRKPEDLDLTFSSEDHVSSLFGTEGLVLPARGKTSTATVELNETAIQALLANGKCAIRWFLIMPESVPDALTAGDYLDLKASAAVEGIGRTDSLLYWEEIK